MIGLLTGKPLIVGDQLIVDCQGVGYQVAVIPQVRVQIAHLDQVSLYIHTHVREEALSLYGFLDPQEKVVFGWLLGVSGVGPSTALNLISVGIIQLIEAIQTAQVSRLTQVPRVGKKLAQKIIIEMRGKVGELQQLDLSPLSNHQSDLVQAMVKLGFDEEKVVDVLRDLSTQIATMTESQIIKLVIQKLSIEDRP